MTADQAAVTPEALAEQLMDDLRARWPEHGRKRMRDMVALRLPAIIAAAREEGREEVIKAIDDGALNDVFARTIAEAIEIGRSLHD